MTNKDFLKLFEERNNGDYSNCNDLYKYLNDSKIDSTNYLLELYFEGKGTLISSDNIYIADALSEKDIKAARYVYLYDIIMNPKKYSPYTNIFTKDTGIWFENGWTNLLKADKKVKDAFFLHAFDYRNKDKKKKVDKLVEKALNTEKPAKKEKLLIKAINYNDALPVYELAKFYYENGNEDLGLEYYQKAFEKNYVDAGLFLADYYHNKKNIDKELEYLSKSIRKEDYKITYRLLKLLQKHNKSLEIVYPFLEWHVYRNESLCYELAKLYENGEFVEKDLLSAYFLYMCVRDYLDSKDKVNELKEILKEVYKIKSNEIFESIITKIDEKEALKAQARKEKALEEKKKKEQLENLRNQYPIINIILDEDYSDYKLKSKVSNEVKKNKEKAYKAALKKKENFEIIKALMQAAKLGHVKAMRILYELYIDFNPEIAFDYLKQVKEKCPSKVTDKEYNDCIKKIDEYKKKQAELNRINNPFDLEQKLKEAYAEMGHNEIIEKLVNEAENGNIKSRYNLAYYYNDKDEIKFKEYLFQIIYGDVSFELLDKLNIDFNIIYNFVLAENPYALHRLAKYVDFEIIEEQLAGLNKLAQKQIPEVIDFLFNYYYKRKELKLAEEYAYLKAVLGDPWLLISNYIPNGINTKTNPKYVELLLKEEYQDNVDVVLCIYDAITNKELREHFNVPHKGWEVNMLHNVENVGSKKQRYKVYKKLAESYEKGIGTLKDLETALHYYFECEDKRWEKVRNEISSQKIYARQTQERSSLLMDLHPCPELDKWLSMGSIKAKNIVKRYGELPRSEAIKDMIERDNLLKLGFTLDEMHDDLGNFIGYQLEKEIKKRIEEKYPTPVVTKNSTQQIIQQEVILEPIENNIKFVLFGKLKEDPYDPDNNDPVFHRYFSSALHTDLYRKHKRNTEYYHGEMQCFYVEELIIDGEKINSDIFYNHISLTLEPGIHSATVTVVLRNHFAGYKLSDYARNRPIGDFDYYPDNRKKNVWKRYRKTLTIDNFEIKPGKVYYLAFWATLYGEYQRVYDGFTKMFVGSELKQCISNFSFDFMTEKQVLNKGNFYKIDEEDFIDLEDIGTFKYYPLGKRIEDV